jgi:hypothetical protein
LRSASRDFALINDDSNDEIGFRIARAFTADGSLERAE